MSDHQQDELSAKRKGVAEIEHDLIHHADLPRTAISDITDKIVDRIGAAASWLWPATVAVILYSVISRYAFSSGSVALEEFQWHLAGAAWLIGLSYTLVHDEHVRVDVLHERLSRRVRAWIEFLGISILLIPFLVVALNEMLPYAYSSFLQGERAQSPNGLSARWILKFFLPISMVLLIAASVSRLSRVMSLLFNFPRSTLAPPSKTGSGDT